MKLCSSPVVTPREKATHVSSDLSHKLLILAVIATFRTFPRRFPRKKMLPTDTQSRIYEGYGPHNLDFSFRETGPAKSRVP